MYQVCAHYEGTTVLLAEFEEQDKAKEFMKHDFVNAAADETEDGTEDIIYSREMFIEESDKSVMAEFLSETYSNVDIPFCEPYGGPDDDLPF